jgi:hypothetical protein
MKYVGEISEGRILDNQWKTGKELVDELECTGLF